MLWPYGMVTCSCRIVTNLLVLKSTVSANSIKQNQASLIPTESGEGLWPPSRHVTIAVRYTCYTWTFKHVDTDVGISIRT